MMVWDGIVKHACNGMIYNIANNVKNTQSARCIHTTWAAVLSDLKVLSNLKIFQCFE